MAQYVERCPIVAPGVIDELDDWGNFVARWDDGNEYDEAGNRRY